MKGIAQDLGEEAVAEHALVIVEADIGPGLAEVGAGEIGQAEDEEDDGRQKEKDDDQHGARRHEVERVERGAEGRFLAAGLPQQDEAADEEQQQRKEGKRQSPLRLHIHLLLLRDFLGGGECAPYGYGRGYADEEGEEALPGSRTARQQVERPQRQPDGAGQGSQKQPERAAVEEAAVGRLDDADRCSLKPGQRECNALIGDDDEAQPRQNETAQENQAGSQKQPAACLTLPPSLPLLLPFFAI